MNDQVPVSAQQSELDDFLARHPDVAAIDAFVSDPSGIRHGIENALEPGRPITGSAYEQIPPALPPNWRDALDVFKAAKFLPR